jgi:hypothetical protein
MCTAQGINILPQNSARLLNVSLLPSRIHVNRQHCIGVLYRSNSASRPQFSRVAVSPINFRWYRYHKTWVVYSNHRIFGAFVALAGEGCHVWAWRFDVRCTECFR